jgi:hypothetical protein
MTERIYRGKTEEMPVIANYLLSIFKADFPDFKSYLPLVFTDDYLLNFEKQITVVHDLLNPQMDTVELKNTTNRLYASMENLIAPVDKLTGYLKFTKGAINVSAKDFGITPLKQKIHSKDAEGIIKHLKTVISNLTTYREPLMAHGLTEDIVAQITSALAPIETENQKQFEILNKRKATVESNLSLVNDLYSTIMEICSVGKTIYKGNALKVKEYTFSELMKKVRTVKKER